MSLEEKKEEIDPLEEFIKHLYEEDPEFVEWYFNEREIEGPIYGLEVIFDEKISDAIRRDGKIPSYVKPLALRASKSGRYRF
jgi:hypothetical protein